MATMTEPTCPDPADDALEDVSYVALDIDPDATWDEIVDLLGLARSGDEPPS